MTPKTLRVLLIVIVVSAVAYLIVNFSINKNTESRKTSYKHNMMSIAAIKKEDKITAELNNSLSEDELFVREDEFLGVDERNGHIIVRRSFCSDVCPVYSYLGLYYDKISAEKCNDAGGEVIIDPAWSAYVGCSPKTD